MDEAQPTPGDGTRDHPVDEDVSLGRDLIEHPARTLG
jgi:hypothetical protein